ncbi:hypothetical protein [Sediminitomix flava]|uniref:Outer membrane protein with beta-barrel domain n=1 Tax=Sediminitomix flava TaxID=379075 RepID=A0A315Z6V0_SEDFL|nr:hypothetical protein [Sediminitomix flava]PWJ40158.1 hypothetical protein BC781_105226 [Sediminitomix flava]
MKNLFSIFLLTFIALNVSTSYAQKRVIEVPEPFIEKGTWLIGGDFAYNTKSYHNFDALLGLMGNTTSENYNFKVSPFAAYFIKDDMAIGGRFVYQRKKSLGSSEILSDTPTSYDDISQRFSTKIFMRNYLRLGTSNRFALFNETSIGHSYEEKQSIATIDGETNGSFSRINALEIGVSPGLVAFINDFTAVEVSLNVLGFSTEWETKTENQVDTSTRTSSSADFMIDLLSLNIGVSFYF